MPFVAAAVVFVVLEDRGCGDAPEREGVVERAGARVGKFVDCACACA